MKILTTLLTTAGVLLGAAGVQATSPFQYSGRDLMLVFRTDSPSGADLEVNLGQVSTFINQGLNNPGVPVSVGGVSTAQWSALVGASSANNVYWAVMGGDPILDGNNSYIDRTLWLTRPRTDVNTPSDPWQRLSPSTQGNILSKILATGNYLNQWSTGTPADGVTNSVSVALIPNSDPSSYTMLDSNAGNVGGSFGQGSVENSFAKGAAGSVRSDFYMVSPGTGSSTYLGYFDVDATGAVSFTAASIQTPAITTDPVGQTIAYASSVTFSVSGSGTQPFAYQWKKNGLAIPGASASSYTISSVVMGDAGSYSVDFRNPAGLVPSASAVLTVTPPPAPVITSFGPVSLTKLAEGTNVTLTVAATGLSLSYQWNLEGAPIAGATNSSYSFQVLRNNGSTNLNYTATVSNPGGSVVSRTALLTIVADTKAPTIAITLPHNNDRLSPFAASGTVSEPFMGKVQYWFSNNVQSAYGTGYATLTRVDAKNFSWSLTAVPQAGTNTLFVKAIDAAGNVSSVKSVAFFYKVPLSFTLNVIGDGGGTLTLKPQFESKIVFLQTTNAAPQISTTIYKNEGYQIITAPNSYSWFSNYSGSIVTNLTTVSFTALDNMTVSVGLNTNRFAMGTARKYNGLFQEEAGDPAKSFERAGAIYGLNIDKKGVFSGKLYMSGTNAPMKGVFLQDGTSTTTVTNGVSGHVLNISMTVDFANPYSANLMLTGSVRDLTDGWTAKLTAYAASQYLSSAATLADVILPPAADAPVANPGGYSTLQLSLSTNGSASLSSVLGDNSSASGSFVASAQGLVPVYLDLYKHSGVLLGWVDATGVQTTSFAWIKKSGEEASLLGAGTWTNTYRHGFTNSAQAFVKGYTAVGAGTNVFATAPQYVEVSGGDLRSGAEYAWLASVTPAAITAATGSSTTNKLALTLSGSKGKLGGSFVGADKKSRSVNGLVDQIDNTAYGVWQGTNEQTGWVYVH